jgi:hypothetical protein
MIVFEGLRVFSPFPSGLGVARPRSEPRLLCFLGVFCVLQPLLAALILLAEDRVVLPAPWPAVAGAMARAAQAS